MNAVSLLPPDPAAARATVLDEIAALPVVVGEREDEPIAEQLAQRRALAGEAFHLACATSQRVIYDQQCLHGPPAQEERCPAP